MTVEITSSNVEELIAKHLTEEFADDNKVRALSQHFRREGYVKLSGLVSPEIFAAVTKETHDILDLHAKRIDIHLKETGNTPRFMSTVSQAAIAADAKLIPAVYESPALKGFLSRIAAEEVMDCPWEGEKYIIIRQERVGDTHGWHWGDFPFTVIWIIEAPATEFGGMLQTVPHTDWNKEDPQVSEYLINNVIKTWPHSTGELYFLRSDTTLHRTIPLNADRTRIILNTCWGNAATAGRPQSHETMEAMFD
ncbi:MULTISPECIES: HalD/BesD family halogenase [Actinoplanes]|uniref:ArpA protein n=2 Tax=Actinoplanes TaxID=1865 RepID=A0A0X3UQ46_9ACTN|nr:MULTISPECIES: ArpA protein [Actinoplanes]KUL34644.1 ArpA protein [Actinoplanes awajinensis subsp. mycoplanecinus]